MRVQAASRDVSRILAALPAPLVDRPVLLGIDGPGGAGKSRLAASLAEALERGGRVVAIVPFDEFFLPSSERSALRGGAKPIGADFDWIRLRDHVLLPLRNGHVARYRRYDWVRDALADLREVQPRGMVIVEGIYSTRRELSGLYDFRLWVDCPRGLRLARGLERDGEAGRDRWELDWMPAEDRYLAEDQPTDRADLVVSAPVA